MLFSRGDNQESSVSVEDVIFKLENDARLLMEGHGTGVYPQILGATHFLDFIWSN